MSSQKNFLLELKNKVISDSSYSVRRYFVDKFFYESVDLLPEKSLILDIGGVKNSKRGMFDIRKFNLEVKYLNISEKAEPDIMADATSIPVEDNSFDGAILGEVLEHISHPEKVLKEAHRVIKTGGNLLITTPFLFQIHGDPDDYLRYTDSWYKKILEEIGFEIVKIDRHGGYFSVLTNQLKNFFHQSNFENFRIRFFSKLLLKYLIKNFLSLDEKAKNYSGNLLSGSTTGFGIVCVKK